MKVQPLLEAIDDRRAAVFQAQQDAIELFSDNVDISLKNKGSTYWMSFKGDLLDFSLLIKPKAEFHKWSIKVNGAARVMAVDEIDMKFILSIISSDVDFFGPIFENVIKLIQAKGYKCSTRLSDTGNDFVIIENEKTQEEALLYLYQHTTPKGKIFNFVVTDDEYEAVTSERELYDVLKRSFARSSKI